MKLYIGAKRVAGRLALVDGADRRLHPGKDCLAHLLLDRPVSATWGERFMLRDHAENVILGSGAVLGTRMARGSVNRVPVVCPG